MLIWKLRSEYVVRFSKDGEGYEYWVHWTFVKKKLDNQRRLATGAEKCEEILYKTRKREDRYIYHDSDTLHEADRKTKTAGKHAKGINLHITSFESGKRLMFLVRTSEAEEEEEEEKQIERQQFNKTKRQQLPA